MRRSCKIKEPEHSHLARFTSLYSALPAGELDFGEPDRVPDLIIHTSNGDLGIEHTQLFRIEAAPNISMPQEQEKLQERVIAHAKDIFEAGGGPMLFLRAYFNHHNVLSKRTVEDVASRVADVISRMLHIVVQTHEGQEYHIDVDAWRYDQDFIKLFPSEIDDIRFRIVDRPGSVVWAVNRGCIVPSITSEYIQSRIRKKEAKLPSYRSQCYEVWLLLVTENCVPSSYFDISEDVANHTFNSRFERVFYFENFDNMVVELNVAP